MKPFDLEAAKRGEPIVCRDGTPAKFIAHVPDAIPQHLVIGLQNRDVVMLHVNGCYSVNAALAKDIFMAPKKRTVWVNFYEDGKSEYFENEKDAFKAFKDWDVPRIGNKAYPVEIEE